MSFMHHPPRDSLHIEDGLEEDVSTGCVITAWGVNMADRDNQQYVGWFNLIDGVEAAHGGDYHGDPYRWIVYRETGDERFTVEPFGKVSLWGKEFTANSAVNEGIQGFLERKVVEYHEKASS